MTLQVYNIDKAADEKGNVIEPPMEGSGTLIRYLTIPFICGACMSEHIAQPPAPLQVQAHCAFG